MWKAVWYQLQACVRKLMATPPQLNADTSSAQAVSEPPAPVFTSTQSDAMTQLAWGACSLSHNLADFFLKPRATGTLTP